MTKKNNLDYIGLKHILVNYIPEVNPEEIALEELEEKESLELVKEAMNIERPFSDREKLILILYFGLETYGLYPKKTHGAEDGYTLDDISETLHITRERIRQIISKSIRKLRSRITHLLKEREKHEQ